MRIVSLTRTDAEHHLSELAEGWEHLGRPERAEDAARALESVRLGLPVVYAGRTVYRIREAQAS